VLPSFLIAFALLALFSGHLLVRQCPQSEQRITHTELAALHQRLRALSESADRFYSTHSAEFKTWIVKNSQSKDMLTFQVPQPQPLPLPSGCCA